MSFQNVWNQTKLVLACTEIFLDPFGKRIDRRFHADDTIEAVRAFLTVHFHENGVEISNFSLSTSFPKRTYDDPAVTLREGDLVPQAVLMVQDLDS